MLETIMVVDDETVVRRIVTRTLESRGYTVLSARSGQRGIECFHQYPEQIQLVLTDVAMPNMSGPEMVDRILQENASVKVLFMTGYSVSSVLPDSYRKRFGVLGKPFTTDSLAEAVRRCLDGCN